MQGFKFRIDLSQTACLVIKVHCIVYAEEQLNLYACAMTTYSKYF